MNKSVFSFCFLSLIFSGLLVIITQQSGTKYMQGYRRGHNGPDSKSGKPLTGPVGSNPTRCAIKAR